jgi:hypothetical protein
MPQPQPATSIAAPQARTACPPAPASSRSSGTGQVMPITAAQRMYFRSPCGRSRPNGRSPARSLHRRTSGPESRTFRIDNRRVSGLPLQLAKGGPCPVRTADNAPRLTLQQGGRFDRIGCRFPTESVAALPRFRIGPPSGPTRGFPSRRRTTPRMYIVISHPQLSKLRPRSFLKDHE